MYVTILEIGHNWDGLIHFCVLTEGANISGGHCAKQLWYLMPLKRKLKTNKLFFWGFFLPKSALFLLVPEVMCRVSM